ncbi:MAG: aspartate-semialdehyde dehydrogenase [Pseudomonadota bacterium]|nr:aspartate-semialdehyde dehydrogenase [Pseudomonadota bacterium]
MKKEKYNVAVVGATGMVGETIIDILAQRDFPVNQLQPLASVQSVGKSVDFKGLSVPVSVLDDHDFSATDIAFFSAGASVSAEHVPRAASANSIVIDNTSEFRREEDIPLVVPEVNPELIAHYKNRGIIANPNCSTIQMVMVLKPIHDAVGIERINVSTYQAVSGAGRTAVKRLAEETATLLNGRPLEAIGDNQKQIAFNTVPHIDTFQSNGYTREEMKMVWETRKILADENIQVNPTAVRIPVFIGHSESIHIETRKKLDINHARKLLEAFPGVELLDEAKSGGYPTPVTDASGSDDVYVGRVREDISHPRGINLWVVADNIRKGAALNSIQIAEVLLRDYL